jgi:hypothetical protein
MVMNEVKKIEARLQKKIQEISALEDKLKAAKAYAQALHDVMNMLRNEGDNESRSESALKQGSAVAQARDVILDRGIPAHINEILDALGKDVTREAKASLTSSLAAYVRRGEIFSRPAPNTFGLLELGHTADSGKQVEPPAEFGRPEERGMRVDDLDDDIPF